MVHIARGPHGGERACLRDCWDGGDNARGEGGARSVGADRGWCTGVLSARTQRSLAWVGRVVQEMAVLGLGTGSGGGQWSAC